MVRTVALTALLLAAASGLVAAEGPRNGFSEGPLVRVDTAHVETAMRRIMSAYVTLQNLGPSEVLGVVRCFAMVKGETTDVVGGVGFSLDSMATEWREVMVLDVPEGADGIKCTPTYRTIPKFD